MEQKTIKKPIELSGVGLHTGAKVNLKFKPAPANTGINFIRVDVKDSPMIKADIFSVLDQDKSPRRTSVGTDSIEIHTIEHLMAALWALGIDNIITEIDKSELPGLDGSAMGFIDVLKTAGIEKQAVPKKVYQVKSPIWVEQDGAMIMVLPDNQFRISYTLNYEHPLLKSQYLSLVLDEGMFEKEIGSSRTFCLEMEADDLRKKGLGKGANYENTIVLGKKGVIDNDLRFEDEFTRHKILDLLGDLYLLGYGIKGHIIAVRSGHPLNIRLVDKISVQREKIQAGSIKAVYIETGGGVLDASDIQKILPHRYPFLLVDKIIELVPDKRAVGIKNVTMNEEFFTGHFPGRPVMPGVLIIEALAQVAGVLMLNKRENVGKLAYFMSLDRAKFRKAVVPGDQLRLEVEIIKLKSKIGQVHTKALVNGQVVSEADLMFALVDA
ncbi:MAG: bifunctional UDP-3-O-[3-hydroxymyristoyl] N-acetylglucosamine deacetylase/3-hydroxyacyl-ACP dehydratase [Candidatus Omnitrophica bacterium]|nr:bifunctional UDP-3-O-[3-hydroxymyristoyl] N-acetylglucosamine deacetylase/3-hydroxyacyl-ACP dehydratase [Candidatus Omnitrophota bacterium]MBU4458045.1 bifunctional UDP-3-O-[3-hydroxymyristoyl] N-acetylglucosamine deacetylase/3-hydroxyacyl-ACP dehydratase [Candidatus Omnitrophota bacterium]